MTCSVCDAPGEPVTLSKHGRVRYRIVLCPRHMTDASVNLGYERGAQ